ncbi:MAG: major capsid protein [Microviridae sp.]|nr:MAG: major capsid protein [Microviridae sp.]
MSYQRMPSRELVSQQDSALNPRTSVPRSRFLNNFGVKTTFDAGLLIPFLLDEILPGDMMKYDVTAYLRMATPLFPIFDNQRIDTHFFFVPTRLLWDNFVKMMGEQDNPADSIAFTVPYIDSPAGGFAVHSIFDQFGLPCVGQITAGQTIRVNALPLRAYNLIVNQWFKDQNLQNNLVFSRGNGPDVVGSYALFRRAKAHDYFTSCLPWPQKFTAPNVPLLGTAPIVGLGFDIAVAGTAGSLDVRETSNAVVQQYAAWRLASSAGAVAIEATGSAANAQPLVFANLAAASGVSINQLREAFLIQQLLEQQARGGTRYTEIVFEEFGITSDDARLQRAEYIGGGSSALDVTPIAQTATGGGGVGALGAAATSVGSHRASFAAKEHGYVIGLISVRTELSYQQGLHRLWTRFSRPEYYTPVLAGLGEQAVLRQELYCTGVDVDDLTVFGYQERWQEYRTRYSEVRGMFRSTTASNIDEWHLAEQFASPPVLGSTFIQDTPPMARILPAANTNQQYLADIHIRRDATRPIPQYGIPVTLGRM